MRAEMQEAIAGNLTIEELISINKPWCGKEILRRLYDDPDLVVDTTGYWTEEEYEEANEVAYDNGQEDGFVKGEIAGYKKGYDDAKAGKEFDEDYK